MPVLIYLSVELRVTSRHVHDLEVHRREPGAGDGGRCQPQRAIDRQGSIYGISASSV